MNYIIHKKNKIKNGYQNAAIYNFSTGKVYLVNLDVAYGLTHGNLSKLDPKLISKLCAERIISNDISQEAEKNVFEFDYELFDDCYSFEKCKLAYLEVTDVCNYQCIHCYANINSSATSFLSLEIAEKYLRQIASIGKCDVRVTGGEPFLNKNICQIFDAICGLVTPITQHSAVTNGSFELKDALHALELGFELQISIYGINSDKFCYFTKSTKYNYEKVISNLINLSKTSYREQIVLLFSVNALTYNDMDAFVKMANKLGYRYIFNRPASVGRAVSNWSQLQLSDENQKTFARLQRNPNPYFCYHLCQLHWTSIMVNGDITPCGFLRSSQNVMGNLNEETFAKIWNGGAYKLFRNLCANDVEYCRNCEFEYMCTAGCCGETLAYAGDMLKSYSWCQIKPYQHRPYLIIGNDEIFSVQKNAAGIFDFTKI